MDIQTSRRPAYWSDRDGRATAFTWCGPVPLFELKEQAEGEAAHGQQGQGDDEDDLGD